VAPRSERPRAPGAHQVAVRPDEVLLAQAAGREDALPARRAVAPVRGLRLRRRHADLKHVAADAAAQRLGHLHRAWPAQAGRRHTWTVSPSKRLMRGSRFCAPRK